MEALQGRREEWTTRCPHCGRELLTFRGLIASAATASGGGISDLPMECSCEAARAERLATAGEAERAEEEARRAELERRRERRFVSSGMPGAWRDMSLLHWDTNGESRAAAYAAAERFIREAAHPGGRARSLFISGGVGTGKTFFAACIARDLHRQLVWVQWASVGMILGALRDCYGRGESAEAALSKYKRTAVLVLDDLGKERPTEWAVEQLYALINHRYEHDLPTIITTTYGGERLTKRLTPPAAAGDWADDTTARAIVDRLREVCVPVTLTGESRRQRAQV